jgi:aryl sulfotransferase
VVVLNQSVWLASYPKSGNTWFRALLGALSVPEGGTLDINGSLADDGNAADREMFDDLTILESALLTRREIDRLRPKVYESMAAWFAGGEGRPKRLAKFATWFVKVHSAYTRNDLGEPVLGGARAAKAAILIVRDPRDMIASLANHSSISLDEAIAVINAPSVHMSPDSQAVRLSQNLLSWSGHAASWLGQSDIPVHLMRYEDLTRDAAKAFGAAMAFAGTPVTPEQAERAARLADFIELARQERDQGFAEKPSGAAAFFRRGECGAWRTELTSDQVSRIETAHGQMMRQLGYVLSNP